MKSATITRAAIAVLCTLSGSVIAGGLERTATNFSILYEKGPYVELSAAEVDPTVKGTSVASVPPAGLVPGRPSGDLLPSYRTFAFGAKFGITDNVDGALIIDQPVGAHASYPAGTGYLFAGTTAKLDSHALTALARYKFSPAFSAYIGPKIQQVSAEVKNLPISDPALGGNALYNLHVTSQTDWGYVVGGAYEKPEIALRAALTYTSEITHKVSPLETATPAATGALTTIGNTPFSVVVPQGWTLDLQTGIAANTLVFGQIRQREWTKTNITPVKLNTPLVSHENDVTTYTLGVGQRLNENWSVALQYSMEEAKGGFAGNLSPTDGYNSISLGGTYTKGKLKVSGGVSQIEIGSAKTELPKFLGTGTLGEFSGSSATAIGFKIGYAL